MDLSKYSAEERRIITLDNLSRTTFSEMNVILEGEAGKFLTELEKQFRKVHFKKLKIEAPNNMLWGSLGMQEFINAFLNNTNFKHVIADLQPFQDPYKLKKDIELKENLFYLLGELCAILKQGGFYGGGSDLSNEEILKITKCFIDQNLKDGYKMYHFIKLHEPWMDWFTNNAVYTSTYLLFSMHRDEVLIICISDSL